MQALDTTGCEDAIDAYTAHSVALTQLLAVDMTGRVFCNQLNRGQSVDLSDRDYVMRSMSERRLTTSGYILGRQTQEPILSFAYPIIGPENEVRGAVIVAYDVLKVGLELAAGRPPENQALLLVDANLVRVARVPSDPALIGRPVDREALRGAIAAGGSGSVISDEDAGGQFDAYAPVLGGTGLYAVVSTSEDAITGAAERLFWRNMIAVLLVFGTAGVAALVIGNVSIRLPVLHLTRLTEAMAEGDLGARAGEMRGSSPEHKRLGRSFNRMAEVVEQRTHQLRESESRFRLALSGSPIFVFECDRDLRLTWCFNPPPPLSRDSLIGTAIPDIGGGDAARYRSLYRRAVATRRSVGDEVVHHVAGRARVFDLTLEPRFDDEGRMQGLSGVAVDVTERKRAEEQLRLLAAEIDHRAKNILAVVLSIIRQSAANARTVPDFLSAIDGRVAAMARAHSLLSQSRWQSVELRRLLEEELAAYRRAERSNVLLNGPECMLTPKAALALSLTVHELATNAVKYGGLSSQSGGVHVSWAFEVNGDLVVEWSEHGGPPTSEVNRRGFGQKLIARSLAMDLDGSVEHDIRPGGAYCRMVVPTSHVIRPNEKGELEPSMSEAGLQSEEASIEGVRVLVVEDSALILMEVEMAIEDAGGLVVGPATRLAQASELAASAEFDVALLDVNLDGELTYAVADTLARRSKPFVLATGYDPQTSIVAEYRDRPVLRKPYTSEGLVRAIKEMVG
ncbi:HWE histidine kinase domain-containing protein [Lutibaculum baratangense]|nr:HWE histidine kinase domain-containing protein [Lutibaculum baratangense]